MINEEKQRYEKLPDVLIPWYRENARDLPWRKDKDPYHVWVSEIMLQQTRVEAVKGYYVRFLERLPDISALAAVSEEELLKLWEGLGYYNRAKNLQKAAKIIVEENNGVFPSEYNEILALPGIGDYTAGAIASNCFEESTPAVDGNVLRVITRITGNRNDIAKAAVKKQISGNLEKVYPKGQCGTFTQSLMELGAIICLPNGKPKCDCCPASEFCFAHQNSIEQELPVKTKKNQRKIEEKTVFILQYKNKMAVRKRDNSGLLAGLWEFPNVNDTLTPQEAIEQAVKWGTDPEKLEREVLRSHIFSHVQWNMVGYYIVCAQENEEFVWVTQEELENKIALPSAFKKLQELC